ncbi:lipid droplet-associated protein [Rhodococcus sp. HNM0569]|uniref:lipid droplet-associated protein n=1 Tax=Rhodococcus sp. HNM0569 TaxID=2716340 RepID=UPI00146B9AB3|nr:lipid droplet-associated protein [Rhodococcus sp. HNM0569]NLU82810.1 lipid droplet-associated protein [Rhodococcus sp. HNM0569]
MIRPPFAARVAAGLAATAVEELRKLPSTAVSFPVTAVSHALQTTMRVQQSVTSLAIKGDQVFDLAGCARDEQPEWAVFDDDPVSDGDDESVPDGDGEPVSDEATGQPGRFALYSLSPEETPPAATAPEVTVPEVVEYLDYPELTLAQLRARLRTLSIDELTTLLDYENATSARAPFQTMLENRISTAKAK